MNKISKEIFFGYAEKNVLAFTYICNKSHCGELHATHVGLKQLQSLDEYKSCIWNEQALYLLFTSFSPLFCIIFWQDKFFSHNLLSSIILEFRNSLRLEFPNGNWIFIARSIPSFDSVCCCVIVWRGLLFGALLGFWKIQTSNSDNTGSQKSERKDTEFEYITMVHFKFCYFPYYTHKNR